MGMVGRVFTVEYRLRGDMHIMDSMGGSIPGEPRGESDVNVEIHPRSALDGVHTGFTGEIDHDGWEFGDQDRRDGFEIGDVDAAVKEIGGGAVVERCNGGGFGKS